MDWKTCMDEGNSLKITPDRKRAQFLTKNAKNTLNVLEKIKLNEENTSVFFANYYDALLETMHAIMYAHGYKVKNHYCLGYYLRDILQDRESFEIFDRARTIRNSIIYYGNLFEKIVLEDLIKQMISTMRKLKTNIK